MLLDELVGIIETLKARIEIQRDAIEASERQTRASLVDPFLQALGWDPGEPLLVTQEYKPDIATKSNERVDYALLRDGQPVVLLEAKRANVSLNNDSHISQLYHYFTPASARIGILTNGIQYRFYSDVGRDNVMDVRPFLNIDITSLSVGDLEVLTCFSRDKFNVDDISRLSENLYYQTAIKDALISEFQNPQREFVQWLMSRAYEGSRTAGKVKWFTEHVKAALNDFCVANHEQETIPESRTPPPPPAPDPGWTKLADFEGTSRASPPVALRFKDGKVREIKRWNHVLWEIAHFLVNEGLLTEDKCPITAGKRARNYLVHTQPQNSSGKSFHSVRYLANALCLETGFNAKNTINISKFLLEYLGQDPSQVWLKTG